MTYLDVLTYTSFPDHISKTRPTGWNTAKWHIHDLKGDRLDSKWPTIGHYLISHARYFVNGARWLDHY